MATEIRVPALGESVADATIGRWLKKVGDPVRAGEPLVELETDKVNLEVTADSAGVLQKIERREGESVTVGEVLGAIGDAAPAAAEQPARGRETPAEPAAQPKPEDSRPAAQGAPPPAPAAQPRDEPPGAEVRPSSPSARRLAEERGIDLQQLRGSGPEGPITLEDVQAAADRGSAPGPRPAAAEPAAAAPPQGPVQQPQPAAAPKEEPSAPERAPEKPATAADTRPEPRPAPEPVRPGAPDRPQEERIRLSRRRLTIARRLLEAQQTAAMLTTFNEVDMTAVMELRKQRKESFLKRHGVGLGFMSFFTRAVVGALKAFPMVNAEMRGEELILKHYYDIGIAVSTEEGLVVPVLRDADRKTFAEIERDVAGLADRARKKTLALQELMGGTFTITNGGVFGSLLSTPILNPPQVGILGMHRIQERPVALDGQVVIRPMMYLALSYDHRVVDGREAVQFLVRIKELIEDPESLLLEG